MFLYLLHFEEPLHHARHYLGVTDELEQRLIAHANGCAAALTRHLKIEGLEWKLVQQWLTKPNTSGRDIERAAKRQKNSPRFCPLCCYPKAAVSPMKSRPIALWQIGDFPTTSTELREWQGTKQPTQDSLKRRSKTSRLCQTLLLE